MINAAAHLSVLYAHGRDDVVGVAYATERGEIPAVCGAQA